MATQVRIQLVSEGWRSILQAQATKDLIRDVGEEIAERAGDGFAFDGAYLAYGGGRPGGFVNARTPEAMAAEATRKVLSMAVRP